MEGINHSDLLVNHDIWVKISVKKKKKKKKDMDIFLRIENKNAQFYYRKICYQRGILWARQGNKKKTL